MRRTLASHQSLHHSGILTLYHSNPRSVIIVKHCDIATVKTDVENRWAIITMTTVGQNLISIPTAISAKHWKLSFRSVFFFSEIQHFTLYSLHLRSQVVTRREAEWPRKEVTFYFPSQLFLPHIYFL